MGLCPIPQIKTMKVERNVQHLRKKSQGCFQPWLSSCCPSINFIGGLASPKPHNNCIILHAGLQETSLVLSHRRFTCKPARLHTPQSAGTSCPQSSPCPCPRTSPGTAGRRS